MNKKAFVLMETIVVIVVISVALLTVFASYNKILSKVKTENKYDTSEYIYMTNYVKKYLESKSCVSADEIFNMETSSTTPTNFYNGSGCDFNGNNIYDIKKIHIINNINKTDDNRLKKFDAYMIDYIRKLDVGDNDTIIIVEYGRNTLDDKGNLKKDSNNTQLTETYIASLEW